MSLTVERFAMRPQEVADYTGFSVQRLATLRLFGGGPPFAKIGRSVSYLREDVDAWLRARRRNSTSDQDTSQPSLAA